MENERIASLEKYFLLTCQKSACCKDQLGDPASQGRPWAGHKGGAVATPAWVDNSTQSGRKGRKTKAE